MVVRCYLFRYARGEETLRWFVESPQGLTQVLMLALPPYTNSTLQTLGDQKVNQWSFEYIAAREKDDSVRRID